MQRDSSTYCDEPDAPDYTSWRSTFDPAAEAARAEEVLRSNSLVAELEGRLVPLLVDKAEFWARYFYRWGGVWWRRV
jgi:hypothetical protein